MVRDIDQQIRFHKRLDDVPGDGGEDLGGGVGDGVLGDHYAGVEFMLGDVVGEGADLFYADGGVAVEFDPDGADCWGRGGVGFSGERGVFLEHRGGGTGGEVHFLAAGFGWKRMY